MAQSSVAWWMAQKCGFPIINFCLHGINNYTFPQTKTLGTLRKEGDRLLWLIFLAYIGPFGEYGQAVICSVVWSFYNPLDWAVTDGENDIDLIFSCTKCNKDVGERNVNDGSSVVVWMLGSATVIMKAEYLQLLTYEVKRQSTKLNLQLRRW